MERALNAIQQRMVEEALVEKEVYEAMLQMRNNIGPIVGTPVKTRYSSGAGSYSRTASGDRLPPEVKAVGDPTRDAKRPVAPFIPETVPQSGANPFPTLDRPLG